MADVVVPTAPPLSSWRNVDLIHTGSWAISSGKWDASREDLAAAVAALDCPAVRRPVLKLGHEVQDTGQPAVGWIDNMHLANQGYTLRGDYVGMPGWLGPILPSAYPDRSVEATYDYRCQLGHTHPFVLTAVALLGVTPPGVGTLKSLQDVADLYGVTASASSGVSVVARFNPDQDRWDAGTPGGLGGQFRGDGLPDLDPKRDKLKLAGKIDLSEGESLLSSGKVDGDYGGVRAAWTGSVDGAKSLRLGVGGEGFGARDSEQGLPAWQGNRDNTESINAERARLRVERDRLDAELDRLDADPDADPGRVAALQARFDELEDMGFAEVSPAGYTAKLDQSTADKLRAELTAGLAAGAQAQATLDAYYDEVERLEAIQESLKYMGRKWTDEEDALWDETAAALKELRANEPNRDYQIFVEGSVPGEWADIHYRVELDDPTVGVQTYIAAVPHGGGLDELTANEQRGIFDTTEMRKILKLLNPTPGRTGRDRAGNVLAAAEDHAGAMVALVPSVEDAARLAVDGGEDPDQLHLTLWYLGEAAAIPTETQAELTNAIRSMVDRRDLPAVQAKAFGVNLWNPDSDSPAIVLAVGDPPDEERPEGQEYLAVVREMMSEAWHDGMVPLNLPDQHSPWVPHICLAYGADPGLVAELADRTGPVTFDAIRVAFAGEHVDIPLRANGDVAAAEGDENRLRDYWTRGEGLKRWVASAHPWTTLYGLLRKHVGNERAKRMASEWFHLVFGYWPGDKRHRKQAVAAADRRDFDETRIKRDGEGQFARKAVADILDDDEVEAFGGNIYLSLSEDGAVSFGLPGDSPHARFSLADAKALQAGMYAMFRLRGGDPDEANDGLIDDMLVETSNGPIYVGISRRELETGAGDTADFPVLTLGVPTEAHTDENPDFDLVDLDEADLDRVADRLRRWGTDYQPDNVETAAAGDYDAVLMADHTIRLDDYDSDDPVSLNMHEAADLAAALRNLRASTPPASTGGEPHEVDTWSSETLTLGRWSDGVYVLNAFTASGGQVEVEFGESTVDALIDALSDLVAKDAELPHTLGPRSVTASAARSRSRSMPNPNPTSVAAGVTTDDIRAQYNLSAPHSQWITDMRAEPLELIVADDADGKRYRVPVSVEAGSVTFGSPVEVVIQYVEPGAEPVSASVMVFASRAESRPRRVVARTRQGDLPRRNRPGRNADESTTSTGAAADSGGADEVEAAQSPAARPVNPSIQEETMPLSADVRQRLGLADDADSDAVNAAVAAALDKADAAVSESEKVAASAAATTELEQQVSLLTGQVEAMSTELAAAKAEKAATVKASVLNDALRQGKIAPAEREQWETDYDAAPTAVTRVLASIAPGTRVPVEAAGHSADPEGAEGDDDREFARLYPPALAGAGREG